MTPNAPAPIPGQSPFDAIRHEDEQGEWWSARELAELLGYANWQNFERVIADAMKAAQNSGNDPTPYFIETSKIRENPKRTRELRDYRLTRYACYLIAQNADPNKEIVALAQTYFAVMTREQEELQALASAVGDDPLAEVAQRILQRKELTEAHKVLLARARDAGVITSEQYARFMNAGYQGLYAGMTAADIRVHKGIPMRADISDWMGSIETMANVLRARLAHKMMEERGTSTAPDANAVHFAAGQQVRGWYEMAGMNPEELPTPSKSYQQLVKEEAARIAREEENARGLWALLPEEESHE